MDISDKIREEWSKWIEISEQEYQQNKFDKQNYTYIVDQDTNNIVKYLKFNDYEIEN